ncbi:MAG: energy transducer TonB [Duncaniella sp.]|nr:energy transducer TonB [Duncaniella sp.]
MKKLMTACLVTLLAAGSLSAVENNIDFYLPEGLTDWVRIEGTGVNLRKEPSASAPRLMCEDSGEDGCGYGTMKWGQGATSVLRPVQGGGKEIFPLTGRDESADLWVRLAYFDPIGRYYPVWVKQSFCTIKPSLSLTADNYYANGYQKQMLYIRKGGRYDGLCLFMAHVQESPEDPEGLFVGKLIDGKVFLPLRFSGYLTEVDDARGFEFGDELENTYMGYPSSYVVDADDGNGNGSLTVNLSKMTDADLSKLLERSHPVGGFEIMLVANPFSGGYVQFNVDISPDGKWGGIQLRKQTEPLVKEGDKQAVVAASSAEIVSHAEVAPSFPGGEAGLYSWLAKNIVYPPMAAERKVKGRVVVQFVVLSDGSIGETKIVRSVDADLDKEAVRVVKAMPKWNPGTVGGKPVNVWYTLPITFNIH